MSDLNDLNKPDATSNYSSEVLQTIKGHISRLWSMDYTGMANLVAGMKRLVDLGSGNIQFKKRNSDGSETTIFDSSGFATSSSVTTAVAAEASARSTADTNEVSNRNTAIGAAISTEVSNRNAAISSEAGTRAAADSSLSGAISSLSSAIGGKADAGACYYYAGIYESGAILVGSGLGSDIGNNPCMWRMNGTYDMGSNIVMSGLRGYHTDGGDDSGTGASWTTWYIYLRGYILGK